MAQRVLGSALVAMVVLAGLSGLGSPALADSVELSTAKLPTARDAMASVSLGGKAYVIGGFSTGELDEIVRFDPALDAVTVMAARLPNGRSWPSATSDGNVAYVFGGHDGSNHRDQILRYDPSTDSLQVLAAKLPSPRSYTNAVWAEGAAYVFGGNNGLGAFLDDIVRFDPSTGEVQTLAASLPTARDSMSAVYDGTHIYLFGGESNLGKHADILRFDPDTHTLETLATALPSARGRTSAVWDGNVAWIYGGRSAGGSLDEVLAFDPASGSVSVVEARLPSVRMNTAAASASDGNFVFGGRNDPGTRYSDIVRHQPFRPGPPRAVLAVAGPTTGDITLTWQEPPGAAADGVTSFRIYRAGATGEPELRAEVPADARSFVDRGLAPLATQYYRISAVGSGGEGPRSAESCTAPAPGHLLPSTDRPCAVPAGWREITAARLEVPVRTPLAAQVVALKGAPRDADPRFYDLQVRVNGVALPTVHVFTEGLLAVPIDVVLPAPLQNGAASVQVALRHDPSQKVCLVGAGDLCPPTAPFTVGNGWATSLGPKAELVVVLGARTDGRDASLPSLRIPLVGQATAFAG